MTIKYHNDLIQGSDEWHAARCGLLTASEMHFLVTPTLKIASNDKERQHVFELLAQRITGYVEPSYISDDMLRGWNDEVEARILYAEKYAPVTECGFVTNDRFGFTIGCSPDGLVGDDGMIECKSRRMKYQVQTIAKNAVPDEYMIQVQTALLVTERAWCDYVSYCAGLPMFVKRVFPDDLIQDAILNAAKACEWNIQATLDSYNKAAVDFYPTERKEDEEIVA